MGLYHPQQTGAPAGPDWLPGLGLGHSVCGSAGLMDCSTGLELEGGVRLSGQEATGLAPSLSSPPPAISCSAVPPPQRRAWPSTSCGPPTPPPLLCSPAPKGQGIRANVPLGAVDRDTAALVPAAVGVSGHEAAMAAPAVDLTQVQGHLAHLPLGAHIQLPLEGEQDSGQPRAPGPNTHF